MLNGRLRRFANHVRQVSAERHPALQVWDLISHLLLINLAPRDYYFFQFYKKGLTWDEKARFVSNKRSRYWIFENNPLRYQVIFTDKSVQKAVLKGLDLPTAGAFASLGGESGRSTRIDLEAVLDAAPEAFVIKPSNGTHGTGFRRITKRGGGLFEQQYQVAISDLWQSLQPFLGRGVLFEELLENTAELRRLNPSSLNTFRVLAFWFPDDGWEIIYTCLRVGRKGAPVDNVAAGGLQVAVLPDGTTGPAWDFVSGTEYTHHPDTGVQMSEAKIEDFESVKTLALEASAKLPQMGILGWDIALTTRGAVIVEVNAFPSVGFAQFVCGSFVTDRMKSVLKPRHLFSRYRKTHMHPTFFRS